MTATMRRIPGRRRRRARLGPVVRPSLVAARLALLGVSLAVVYTVFNHPIRTVEAEWSADLVTWLSNEVALPLGRLDGAEPGDSFRVLVLRGNLVPLIAEVSAACSSVPTVLAMIAAGVLLPGRALRRTAASAAVSAVVVMANLIRISACLWVSGFTGTGTTILFHDYAGIAFALASTLFGLVLITGLLLPSPKQDDPRTLKVVGASSRRDSV